MDREKAMQYIYAFAVCSIEEISCELCPFYNSKRPGEICTAWEEDDIHDAVKAINLSGGI